jgi:K+-sensing histidine kinase KdpD
VALEAGVNRVRLGEAEGVHVFVVSTKTTHQDIFHAFNPLAVLQGYSRDVVAAGNTNTILSSTASALAALFQVPAIVMLVTDGRVVSLERVGDVEPQETELEAARSSLATGTILRSDVYPNLASRFDFWPVKTSGGQNAVIGLAFDTDERPSAPDTLVNIVVRVLALVLERQHARG